MESHLYCIILMCADFHATGGMQTTLAALHQQLTEALQREAQSVEEKVRQYSEKQYAELEEFRGKAHDDHRTLARYSCYFSQTSATLLSRFSMNECYTQIPCFQTLDGK